MTASAAPPRAVWMALAALVAHGCAEAPTADPHYVLGSPYSVALPDRSGTFWFYPREAYDLDETGLAAVIQGGHAVLTSDGEAFDQAALAAAHPTLQLPAIASLTNLENGRQVTVRLNDRGAGDPHRLVQVTRRTATLLGFTDGLAARVRLRVLPVESRAAAEALPGAPRLAMSVAPRQAVAAVSLPPPAGMGQGNGRILPAPAAVGGLPEAAAVAPPMRLPDVVVQAAARAGWLMVRLDSFDGFRFAAVEQAKMSGSGARIVSFKERRTPQFRVELGPFQQVSEADAALDLALARGIPDARIVID